MPQFRLTQKFAKDCKIKELCDPSIRPDPFDDWFIDCMSVHRNKIAIITHAKTAFTFLLPHTEAGGAKNIVSGFQNQLNTFFNKNNLPELCTAVNNLFSEEVAFTKTVDKQVLGYMNDFKRCVIAHSDFPFDSERTAAAINDMPMNASSRNCFFPIKRFNALLKINLPMIQFGISPPQKSTGEKQC